MILEVLSKLRKNLNIFLKAVHSIHKIFKDIRKHSGLLKWTKHAQKKIQHMYEKN